MLSERLMVITAETEERQEELIHKIYDEFSTKNLPMTIVYQKVCCLKIRANILVNLENNS